MNGSILAQVQAQPEAFAGLFEDDLIRLRSASGTWPLGMETIAVAASYFGQDPGLVERIEVGLMNDPSLTATWFKVPEYPDAFAIGVNAGLVETIRLIASDVFGYGEEAEDEMLNLGFFDLAAAERVAERIGAFLEIGAPLGNATTPSSRRGPFVNALVEDALQFLILHEFAHILLGHTRGDVQLLRRKMSDVQIATFSIAQEHQADSLAMRMHASMRRKSGQAFPGMEFAGPTLFFGVLGIFERYQHHQDIFDSPHAHPGAYERLYRLRVKLTQGDGHAYWPVGGEEGWRAARMLLDPNPEAVRFADAVAKSLLDVLEKVESQTALPSPLTSLFNRLCENEVGAEACEVFWQDIVRWLFLGNPRRLLQHLREASASVDALLGTGTSDDDQFLVRGKLLIENAWPRIAEIQDYSVGQALRACAG